jgi:regulator of protease activity HflC (stomatin/prohibitin superfamily)
MFCACVDQANLAVIERFGKFDRIGHPGFNCVCCCLGESVRGMLSMRVQQLDVMCDTKTKDNVFVQLQISVQYQVIKEQVYDAFYKLTDSRTQIMSYVYDNVRSNVPHMLLDDVFTAKEEIASSVREELSKAMSSYGYSIVQALVTDILPDQKVRAAMNEINAASRLRVAAVEKGEASKIQVVKAAEAEAEAKYLQGMGIARQRQAIVNGLRESVVAFSENVTDITSRDVIELMMITQYFDTIKDVGMNGRSNTVFLPHTPGGISDVSAQIRAGFLQSQAAANMDGARP